MAVTCGSVFVVVSLIAMTNAYYPMYQNQQTSCYRPQYNTPSCRESIEDLKALIDISNSLKEKNNCETCSRPFSEAVIIKLIDALVATASRNCYKQDDEKGNTTCGQAEKKGWGNTDDCGNTDGDCGSTDSNGGGTNDDSKTGTAAGSKDDNVDKNDDVLTMETLEAALIKLGVLDVDGDKNVNDNTVNVDITNTDVIGDNVGETS